MYTVHASADYLSTAQKHYADQENTEVKKLNRVFFLSLLGQRVDINVGPLYARGILRHTATGNDAKATEYYGFSYGKWDEPRGATASFSYERIRMITVRNDPGMKPLVYIYFSY